ncbi:iron ABC transporter [Desulfosporosinus sp. HMP52]|uniref:ABC transporter permease n=1 Tax=Desulfosporosinus sp. HMP52 TaxID=1487923 RepID=UPI00051FA28F|nr:iron ABC transporter permease [Desulfosporosinus sp. HMP52]KGK89067.1 iron ABC transporter [Desulfosporosinus sp. HMP52]
MSGSSIKRSFNLWGMLSAFFAALIILPNVDLFGNLFVQPNENWYHIKTYLLKDYITNTLVIIGFTGVFTVLIGSGMAWLISAYDFPGRRIFNWALILPLTIPPYIGAYTYNGILNYTGVVQRGLRNVLEVQVNPKWLDIMNIQGAIFIFAVFLFPYVYTVTRAFLTNQSASLIENARLLGKNSLEIFVQVVLPISRGAILGGMTLVIFEVLNDYGVVSYFGVQTFSTAIFKAWFSMGDIDTAVKLSGVLMTIVISVLLLERGLRGRKKYSYTTSKVRPIVRTRLRGMKGFWAFFVSFIFLSLGFIIPVLQLLVWSTLTFKKVFNIAFLKLLGNSVVVALVAALIILGVAVIIANFSRLQENWVGKLFTKVTLLGYSIPGAVISIGVILFFVDFDRKLEWFYKALNPNSITLVLSSSVVMLIFAYSVRFLAVGYQSIEAGFEKVGKKFFEASRMLGNGVTKTFFRVDLPMIKPAVISAFALTFVDIVKELPLTLILRPYNFNTLATKTYEYATDEMIHEAAIPALLIILVSITSVYLLNKLGEKEGI